jgi:hypothetical protein
MAEKTEKILFTVDRNGIMAQIVEHEMNGKSVRFVRLAGIVIDGVVNLNPDQCDIVGSLGSIARANSVVIERLRESGAEERVAEGRNR